MRKRFKTAGCAAWLALGLAAAWFSGSVAAQSSEPTAAPLPLRDTAAFGAYAPGLPYYPRRRLPQLEQKLGTKLEIVSGFVDWEYILGEKRDRLLADGGERKLLYSWEPHCSADGRCITFRDVAAGELDGYLERVAASMKRFPHEIYVRPWAEMNAHWSPYRAGSGRPAAGSAEEFKQAWRHLVGFFRARNVLNLRFVFNPDAALEQGNADIREIWPGQDYVDVLGIDGYNWGESGQPGGNVWLEFDAIFGEMYRLLTSLHPSAPVWICEFGSKEPRKNDGSQGSPAPRDHRHSKAHWIDNFMASTAFPRIEALVYYNAFTPGRDNQRDFRFESSRESLDAIRRQLRLRRRRAAPIVKVSSQAESEAARVNDVPGPGG
jgi:hypothetical protein